MSYRLEKAKKLKMNVEALEEKVRLNARAIDAVKASGASRYIVEELELKDIKLRKKLAKADKKYINYADDHIKISEIDDLDRMQLYDEDDY